MLKKSLFALAAILAVLLIVVAVQPSSFQVQRTAKIAAPSEVVFAHINDFHKWNQWSPYARLDPKMQTTFEGPKTGNGAVYSWFSQDPKVGQGRMTILDSKPGELVKIKLEFIKPFAATNTAEFILKPDGKSTSVTWAMSGSKNFMMKGFGLVMDMDKMVGSDFEKGLATMKSISEKQMKA